MKPDEQDGDNDNYYYTEEYRWMEKSKTQQKKEVELFLKRPACLSSWSEIHLHIMI